jgi:AcrR family transcriptional regulator
MIILRLMEEATATAGLRERKRVRTRRAIADAALELFDRHGFHATTIPQIAAAADVSPRTVSGYFPAKEDLAFPEADERITELEQRLRSRPPGETAAVALRAWLPEMIADDPHRAEEHRRRRAVIDADEALCAYEHRFMSRAQTALTEAFAADLGAGPDALEPRMAAAATMTVFEVLGRDLDPAESPLAALDRALVFIGGGIGALRDPSR